jgi:hypothetical protein
MSPLPLSAPSSVVILNPDALDVTETFIILTILPLTALLLKHLPLPLSLRLPFFLFPVYPHLTAFDPNSPPLACPSPSAARNISLELFIGCLPTCAAGTPNHPSIRPATFRRAAKPQRRPKHSITINPSHLAFHSDPTLSYGIILRLDNIP